MNGASQGVRDHGLAAMHDEASKVMSIDEAVARHVLPASNIFLGQRAYAGLYAILRRFWGTSPAFTLTSVMTSELMLLLVEGGLLRKLITSQVWGAAGNRTFQRALHEGSLEAEMWTIHTIILRLMAGGLGVPFLPTRSIRGTDMARELHAAGYAEITDPFGSGERAGLVSALRPDVALIHGLVADEAGNTVLNPDWRVDCWGARASRGAVIVMVEEIVPAETLHQYAPLVSLPAYTVSAVCRTPFGAFPQTVYGGMVAEAPSYVSDRAFTQACARAARAGGDELAAWIREWILEPDSHENFLAKVGPERLEQLRAKARAELAQAEVPVPSDGAAEYTSREAMTVTAARRIAERVQSAGYRFIQTGPGFSALATYLAYHKLRQAGYQVEVMSGFGNFGYTPLANAITSLPHLATATMLADMHEMYGAVLRGSDSRGMVVLGIAEIDRHGNVNTSRLADGRYLAGSGGHNDCVMGAAEVLYVTPMEARRFRDEVSFLTTPGDRLRVVVTDLGVLEKRDGVGDLVFSAYQAGAAVSADDAFATASERCGWPLAAAPDVRPEAPPTPDELRVIRGLDPDRVVLG